MKVTKEDMPPKGPSTAWIIFYTKYLKGLSDAHKPKSLADTSSLVKDASSMWRSLSEAEKQVRVLGLPERVGANEGVPGSHSWTTTTGLALSM